MVAGAGALFWGFFWFGLIDLLVVIEQDEIFHRDYILESGWGLLFLVLVAVPLVVLTSHPGFPGGSDSAGCCHGSGDHRWAATAGMAAGAERPGTARHRRSGRLDGGRTTRELARPDLALSVLAVVAVPAAAAYGFGLLRNTVVEEDITNGVSHWPMQASLALAVVGLVGLAAVTRARLPGWTAAFAGLWLGIESVTYPNLFASLGHTGGLLTVGWAVLVVVALEFARGRAAAQAKALAKD